MRGFATIAAFEIGQRLRRLSTHVYFGLFLLLGYFFFITAAGAFAGVNIGFGTGGKVMVNSPHTLAGMIGGVAFFLLPVVAALAGQAIHQDFEQRTYAQLFTTPIGKLGYLGGRFAASLVVLLYVHLSVGLGCLIGSFMPFLDAQLIGPQRALAYLGPYLTLVVPNLLITAPIFFALGALTRKMRTVYVTAVVLLLGNLLAGALSSEIDNKQLASLLDPLGGFAFERLTEYWSVAEKNHRLIPLAGVLLTNRVVWLALGVAVLIFTYRRFAMAEPLERAGLGRPVLEPPAPAAPVATGPARWPSTPALVWRLGWLAFRETCKSVHFLVITLGGVLFVVVMATMSNLIYGTATYPVTRAMLDLAHGSFRLFALAIVVVYAGDLVFRERDARFDQIADTLPIPSGVLYGAKLLALMLVGVVLELVVIATSIGIQVAKGYYRFELPLYGFDLLLRLVEHFQLAALALFFPVALGNKHLGQFAMVLYFIGSIALPALGFEHRLYRYGSAPDYTYSDMNGYGHTLLPWAWFNLYWSLAAAGLCVATRLLWLRGPESNLRLRLRRARAELGGARPALIGLGLAFAATGAYIFYNTNVRNQYLTRSDNQRLQADYELTYKKLAQLPQPRVVDVRVHFDVRPETRNLRIVGTYRLRNQGTQPIPTVWASLAHPGATVHRFAMGDVAAPSTRDERLRTYSFTLPRPLPTGEDVNVAFDLEYPATGFRNGGAAGVAVDNGTFVNSSYLPLFGYLEKAELSDPDERRKRKLPPRPRFADLNDKPGRLRNYLSADADWIDFAATVCTSPDQQAFAPGQRKLEWHENGRRCFAYELKTKVLHFFAVLSARYATRHDRHRGVDIEIHHQPGHEYNLERMIAAIKASLDYFQANFSPYQHKVVRILEFPLYEGFAQAFPNTIPYSESLGFIARVDPDNPKDVDYPYYVTAHEVAHQWWAHQVIGADVQGATMLSESLAQYSALMVMKARYGAQHMQRFLRHELDSYLRSRALERHKELPLMRVEDQPYIHYNKGSLVFYTLADAIGEAAVNKALAALLSSYAFRGPPYPTTLELLAALEAVTPPAQRYLLDDLFRTITLFENRAQKARGRAVGPDEYEVEIDFTAKKLRADELGNESEVTLAEPLDVGVMGADGKALVVERKAVKAGAQTVVLRCKGVPARAGIDPLNKLVDRQPDDNLALVELAEDAAGGKATPAR